MAKVPINRAMLDWSMRDGGVDVADLQAVTKRDAKTVKAWINGDDQPHQGDVTALAKLFGRSTQFFFLPSPPRTATYAARFRASPGKTLAQGSRLQELKALRSAQRIQKIAAWHSQGTTVAFPPPTLDPESYAAALVEWLHWSPQVQVNATSKARAFSLLRQQVEARGVIVLLRDIGPNACRGFSLPHPVSPVALVNKGYDLASVRSYTLIHELAHLARGQESVCHGDEYGIERWCDKVSAAFLMPAPHLRAYVSGRLKKSWIKSDDLDSVRLVANRYKTSWQAAARRLRDLGLAGDALVAQASTPGQEPIDKGFRPGGGQSTAEKRLDEFGSTYPRVLLRAAAQEQLSGLDLRQYLRVDGKQLAQLNGLLQEQGN